MLRKILTLFKKPKVFFTSDLHFSHKNVILYCNRPWKDVETMNEALVELWNKQVSPKDTVYCLGDFSLNTTVMKKFTPRLNGNKILIAGNHDKCFAWNGRAKPSELKKYIDAGWEVHQTLRVTLKNNEVVLLSHLPYADETALKYDTRYLEYRPKDGGRFLLHGHQHNAYLKNGNRIDVGIDHNFKLFSEDEIISLINDKRKFIPGRLTGRKVKND